ncbi:uncharacterized protein LOC130504203 [Raphanus sativus]|uniref:Uncharacterized protein LOC130504203 n=1 Tax=Raphanus sativus TaxID=3726 RepID=A0A9W3CTL9_RAPSA|nr:uncharacterized protein LOC130504203 [Raphanus sativus]
MALKPATQEITPISELKPRHTNKVVHVKVLHSWTQNINQGGETMEFVFSDENGDKIHGSCKKTYFESKERLLPVGAWRNVRNFHVRPAGGAFRTTNHTYKIVFNQATAVTRSNFINDELYLNLVDFQTVLTGTLDENLLIDVLGQVLDCGDVETILCSGGNQRKKLEFILRDMNDVRLPCCIWGKLTDILHSARNEDDGMVTLLLRFAKIGKFRGELQISNSYDASQMIINPTIPDAEAFKDMDTGDEKSLMLIESKEEGSNQVGHPDRIGHRDKWLQYPTKKIHELLGSTQVGRCLVTCYVYEIDMDWSWFWLHLIVRDDTGVSKIMILDKVANGIVAKTPLKLLNGSWEELEDTSLIPEAITDLIGKSFTFGVYVEKDNVSYGAEIFKVGKIYKDRLDCLTGALTPGSVNLTDSQELNDYVSTPSSKRKEDESISHPDISSTTKRPCLMKVKQEKAEDAAKKRG